MIRRELGDQLIGHIKYDGTAIEAREKAVAKPSEEEKPKHLRSRPRKGEERPATEPTVLEKQQHQSLDEMLNEIPKDCDIGCKKNSTGHKENWRGYKLHIATADGDIPVAALLSSASMHDSGAILPLTKIVQQRVTSDTIWPTAPIAARLSAMNHAKRGMFRSLNTTGVTAKRLSVRRTMHNAIKNATARSVQTAI